MATIEFPLACTGCGGILTGVALDGHCPQCGRSVGDSINLAIIDPVTLRVTDDTACIRCGYNVRTLVIDAVCPECAEPVVRSLRPNELESADTEWLRRVRSGVTWLLVAWLGALATLILARALEVTLAPRLGRSPVASLPWYTAVTAALAPIWCVGVFRATARDPRQRGRRESGALRRLTITCAIGTPILLLFVRAITPNLRTTWGPTAGLGKYLLFLAVSVTPVVIGCLGIGALGLCLRRLARRARRTGLRRSATGFAALAFALIGMFVFTTVLGAWARTTLTTRAMAAVRSNLTTNVFRSTSPPPSFVRLRIVNRMIRVVNYVNIVATLGVYGLGLAALFKCRGMLAAALARRGAGVAVERPAGLG